MRPGEGRRLVTPQKLAGVRNEPARSDPWASQAMPVAREAAAPPEDPPAVRRRSWGLRVAPKTSLKVLPPAPNSGVFDLAYTTAPLASSVSTMTSDRSGTKFSLSRDP